MISKCHEQLTRLSETKDIAHLASALRGVFENTKDGSLKGDICRGAVLHNIGGYYMDVDIEAVSDVRLVIPEGTDFTTSKSAVRACVLKNPHICASVCVGSSGSHGVLSRRCPACSKQSWALKQVHHMRVHVHVFLCGHACISARL